MWIQYTTNCTFNILWKDVYYPVFYSIWKSLICHRHFFLSETVCRFCFQCFVFKYLLKNEFYGQIMGLTCTISIVNWIFLDLFFFFLLFFTDFNLLKFHNNTGKLSEQMELVENLHPKYLPCRFLHILVFCAAIFTME